MHIHHTITTYIPSQQTYHHNIHTYIRSHIQTCISTQPSTKGSITTTFTHPSMHARTCTCTHKHTHKHTRPRAETPHRLKSVELLSSVHAQYYHFVCSTHDHAFPILCHTHLQWGGGHACVKNKQQQRALHRIHTHCHHAWRKEGLYGYRQGHVHTHTDRDTHTHTHTSVHKDTGRGKEHTKKYRHRLYRADWALPLHASSCGLGVQASCARQVSPHAHTHTHTQTHR